MSPPESFERRSKKQLSEYLQAASKNELSTLLKTVLSKSEDAEKAAREEVVDRNNRAQYKKSQARGDNRWKMCVRCDNFYDTQGLDLVCTERHHPGLSSCRMLRDFSLH